MQTGHRASTAPWGAERSLTSLSREGGPGVLRPEDLWLVHRGACYDVQVRS